MLMLRPIEASDNPALARLIRTVMPEFGCVGEGYSINDAEVDHLFEAYATPRAGFYLVEAKVDEGTAFAKTLLACAGFAQLTGADETVCELRKMYGYAESRGKGAGRLLMEKCLTQAHEEGFKYMYLETVSAMTQAAKLYEQYGFKNLKGPMGGTGHTSCDRYMLKVL